MLTISTCRVSHRYFYNTKRLISTTKGTIKKGWEAVIGIEVHAQLNTKTKLFSGKKEKLKRNSRVFVP